MEPLQFPGRPSTGVYGYRETVSVLGVWCHKMAPLRQPRISSGLTMPPDGHIFKGAKMVAVINADGQRPKKDVLMYIQSGRSIHLVNVPLVTD